MPSMIDAVRALAQKSFSICRWSVREWAKSVWAQRVISNHKCATWSRLRQQRERREWKQKKSLTSGLIVEWMTIIITLKCSACLVSFFLLLFFFMKLHWVNEAMARNDRWNRVEVEREREVETLNDCSKMKWICHRLVMELINYLS